MISQKHYWIGVEMLRKGGPLSERGMVERLRGAIGATQGSASNLISDLELNGNIAKKGSKYVFSKSEPLPESSIHKFAVGDKKPTEKELLDTQVMRRVTNMDVGESKVFNVAYLGDFMGKSIRPCDFINIINANAYKVGRLYYMEQDRKTKTITVFRSV